MELRWRLLRDIWVRGKRNSPHPPSFVLPPLPGRSGGVWIREEVSSSIFPILFGSFTGLALLFWNTTGAMPFCWNVCSLLTPPLIRCVRFFIDHIPDHVKTIEKYTAKKNRKNQQTN